MADVVKDAAGIAMEAINYARDSKIDVVLVDTAGRMQVRVYFTPQTSIIVLFSTRTYHSVPEPNRRIQCCGSGMFIPVSTKHPQ